MKLLSTFPLAAIAFISVQGALLVDFNAARGDEVKKLGSILTLEKTRDVRVDANIPQLYIKSDKDWKGAPSAHVHKDKGYLRAEYRALKDQIKEGQTYFIGYRFAVDPTTPLSYAIFQWKETKNTDSSSDPYGINIPMWMEINGKTQQLEVHVGRPGGKLKPLVIWQKAISKRTVIEIGMKIVPKKEKGTIEMWYNGRPMTFDVEGTGKTGTWVGTTMPGSTSPKWGAYNGEEGVVDTWIYNAQVGQDKSELDKAFFGE